MPRQRDADRIDYGNDATTGVPVMSKAVEIVGQDGLPLIPAATTPPGTTASGLPVNLGTESGTTGYVLKQMLSTMNSIHEELRQLRRSLILTGVAEDLDDTKL